MSSEGTASQQYRKFLIHKYRYYVPLSRLNVHYPQGSWAHHFWKIIIAGTLLLKVHNIIINKG